MNPLKSLDVNRRWTMAIHPGFLLLGIAMSVLSSAPALGADVAPPPESQVIFRATDLPGGISIPLPSLLVTEHGTVLALGELRKASKSGYNDFGHESDIVLRRSSDGGRTWGRLQVIYANPSINAINGPIVEDRIAHKLILPFTAVPATAVSQADWVRHFAEIGGGLWIVTSEDDGKTWSKPVE